MYRQGACPGPENAEELLRKAIRPPREETKSNG
jgi:hypothetical protein